MCGFAGFIGNGSIDRDKSQVICQMTDTLYHRGPDSSGTWIDPVADIALGHRRLSIIELSDAGHQPMHSHNQDLVLTFNGEIYNHLELRKILDNQFPAIKWNGFSDTESLLAGFEHLGISKTLQLCIGMFAFALWDRKKMELYLGRDRMGEKPLYYGWSNNDFLFGSELKALKKYPFFNNAISRSALSDYMQFSYVPCPKSIYEDIYKLEPGTILTLKHEDIPKKKLSYEVYWHVKESIERGRKNLISERAEALDLTERALKQAVKLQMLADVPVGAFLSGGVDSTLIVSLMQQESLHPVQTFTVGFEEAGFDEAPYAKAIANFLGTNHTEIYVTNNEAQAVISDLPATFDEPFADSSQIPTFLIAVIAKAQVKVALSGDAGDEIFGGYNRYFWAPSIWNKLKFLPYSARQLIARSLRRISPLALDSFVGHGGIVRPGEKIHKLSRAMRNARSLDDLYLNLVRDSENSLIKNSNDLSFDDDQKKPLLFKALKDNFDSPAQKMMYCDSISYLPDDILCKVDRAAMANSLETRTPFLDHRVIDLSWRIPPEMNIQGDTGKLLLKEILYQRVPREMIERPKSGFSMPVSEWLRGPLRDWAEDLLSEERLRREGYFDVELVQENWSQHLSGKFDWSARLWNILMFQAWLEAQ